MPIALIVRNQILVQQLCNLVLVTALALSFSLSLTHTHTHTRARARTLSRRINCNTHESMHNHTHTDLIVSAFIRYAFVWFFICVLFSDDAPTFVITKFVDLMYTVKLYSEIICPLSLIPLRLPLSLLLFYILSE